MTFNRPIANPIFTREYRARWRNGLSSVLLFCYALLLAIAAGLVYASASFSTRDTTLLRQMAETGHNLFLTLSAMQIGAWLLLGPALTATSIAGERERGLLEMLQLTPLSARRICVGKMLSISGFVVLLMFAPLPMTALCFLLGGVSPGEFCAALALQVTSAIFGLSIGIWASAWSRRATTAMALAFGVIIGWGIFTVFVLMAHGMLSPWANLTAAKNPWQSFFLDGLWRTNPLLVFATEATAPRGMGNSWLSTYTALDYPDWIFCGALQIVISLALLMSATRALWRPLDEEPSTRIVKKTRKKRRSQQDEYSDSSTATRLSVGVAPEILPSRKSSSSFEIAALANYRSENPVMEREVRRWGRMGRVGLVASRWARIGLLLGVGIYLLGIACMMIDPLHRGIELFWSVVGVGILLSSCLACATGAVLFTREREAGTWENLQLSLLSPKQILFGKFVPACLLCVTFCVVFWLPTLLCVDGVLVPLRDSYLQVSFSQWIYTLLMALGTAWLCLCLGTMMSAFAKRIWMSVSWTIGATLLLYVALPLLTVFIINLFRFSFWQYTNLLVSFLSLWHPFFAIISIMESVSESHRLTSLGIVTLFLATTLSLGSLMLAVAHRRLKRSLLPSS